MGSFTVGLSIRGCLPREGELLFPDGEVSAVEDFGNDVDTLFELEVDQIRLAVFDFVEGWLFRRGALDISESVFVINRRDEERLATGFRVEPVVELELRLVIGAKLADLLGSLRLGSPDFGLGLCAESLRFSLVGFG